MVSELRPVVKAGGLRKARVGDLDVHQGTIGGVEVTATLARIGTTLSAEAAERLIAAAAPDHVVVSGIAGGLGASKVGDLFVPATVTNHDTGESATATPLGPIAPAGSIVTSGELLTDLAVLDGFVADGFVAIDMETAAIAVVCERHGVPWTAFRGISDLAGDGADPAILGLVDAEGSASPGKALRYLVTHPQRIPELTRLARGSALAANRAADATIAAIRSLPA
jgi:adenosylhomocysteine nucleosidase